MTPRSTALIDRLLDLMLVAAGLMALLCLIFITAEYDEAWIVASGRQGFDETLLPQVRPVLTTGGLYLLATWATTWLPGDPLLLVRCFSLICAILLGATIYYGLGRFCPSSTERRLLLVTSLGVPGTILMAGMGYAAMAATMLLLIGLLMALRRPHITLSDALIAGLCLGLAMTTRWTMIPALPALLLIATCSGAQWRANLARASLAIGVAVAVFALVSQLQIQLLDGTGPTDGTSFAANAKVAGASTDLPHPTRLLAAMTRVASTLPMSLLATACIAFFAFREDQQQRRVVIVLMGAASLILMAWMLRAPYLHLRYVWPSYLLISICAGLGLAAFWRTLAPRHSTLAHLMVLLPIGLGLAQMVLALRLAAVGAGMQVNNAGYDNQENHYKPLHLFQEQRAIVQYLRDVLPAGAIIAGIDLPNEQGALELALLSQVQVFDIAKNNHEKPQTPDFILTHRFAPLNADGRDWLANLGEPAAQVHGYTLYPFPESARLPDPADIALDPQLYRFALEKWVSLTLW